MLNRRKITAFLLAINLILFGSFPVVANERDRTVNVMTYNMYLGTDFSEIFATQTPEELVAEVAEAYTDVVTGLPAERVAAIADQIEAGTPALVGLQEVALWRVGIPFDPAPATTVTYDFLQLLLDELAARDLSYEPIVVWTGFDAELPGVFSPTSALDIRYTDRVVILARTDLKVSQFKLEGTQSGQFATNLTFTSPTLGTITIARGWTSADVKMRGKTYRFINAHLEAFNETVQYVQAGELLTGPAVTGLPTVLAGDFNSDAATSGATYLLFRSAGFNDSWDAAAKSGPGYTFPLFLANPWTFTDPNERLDLILTRGKVDSTFADVMGEDPIADVTTSGYRPSDHAGVLTTIVLEP